MGGLEGWVTVCNQSWPSLLSFGSLKSATVLRSSRRGNERMRSKIGATGKMGNPRRRDLTVGDNL